MESFWQDVRYGIRMLIKNPGFTAVAVLTLALGIGANTAIFSVVNGVLLQPLPYPNPERMVALVTRAPGSGFDRLGLTEAEFMTLRQESRALKQVGAYVPFQVTLTGLGEAERVGVAAVSADLFPTLGVEPVLGRSFLPEEEEPGRGQAIILSYSMWQRQFGGEGGILGSTVTLNGTDLQVVGVMPPGFRLPDDLNSTQATELWVPATLQTPELNWGSHYLTSVGRMQPGGDRSQVQAEIQTLFGRLAQERPEAYPQDTTFSVEVILLHDDLVSNVRPALWLLFGAVGLVLLIACANIANLLLARGTAREKELAIRAALGAGRLRLVRQLLSESLLLSVLGGAAGLLLAWWGFQLIGRLSPSTVARVTDGGINAQVLAFTAAVALATTWLIGLGPALQVSRPDLNRSLKEEGRGLSSGATRQRLQRTLVVTEVALAVALVVGAGLLLRSFVSLLGVDPGFNPSNLLTARLSLPSSRYPENQQVIDFHAQLLERVKTLPGVSSAAAVTRLPLKGFGGDTVFDIEGRPSAREDPAAYGASFPHLGYRPVTPGYFRTMRIRLLQGRVFDEFDRENAPLVAVINQTLAQRFFAGEDPIGQRLRLYWSVDQRGPWIEIVGIVADTKISSLDEEVKQEIFVPVRQVSQVGGWVPRGMTLVLHTSARPTNLVNSVRGAVQGLDASLPVYNFQTMEQVLSGTIAQPRSNLILLGVFAVSALVLAAIGIYGVLSYSVTQRTHEIGIRMALGAKPRDILRLVVRQGMTVALLGAVIGLVAAYAASRLISSLLFGVEPTDPLTYVSVGALLLGVALLACYVPARRATRVDPMVALRYE